MTYQGMADQGIRRNRELGFHEDWDLAWRDFMDDVLRAVAFPGLDLSGDVHAYWVALRRPDAKPVKRLKYG